MINKDSIPAFQEHLVHHTNVATSMKHHNNNQPETPEHMKDLIEATLQNVSEKEGQQVDDYISTRVERRCKVIQRTLEEHKRKTEITNEEIIKGHKKERRKEVQSPHQNQPATCKQRAKP
ncbi:hypothetical protein DPMN_081659 [Dreissena polymorpha]|uniref:Uncharacterized protein n=1 Tax=Dreissena polymorpha TaxID=45954 RepID=A0A9D3Y9F0_DREPO|nr:hypothetical protein DPMN_081659 [Dreissena polymorpha]